MNCAQIKEFLPAYLDNEVNPSERRLIQAHLAGCNACQRDLALLSQTRNLVSQSLNIRAADAAPSQQALSRLQARLADEALRPHLRLIAWFKRSAPSASRTRFKLFSGDVTMQKQKILATGMSVLVIAVVAVLIFNSATPVSAQQILERAAAAQSAVEAGDGIWHTVIEVYDNPQVIDEPNQGGTTITMERYTDTSTGYYRDITVDAYGDTAGNLCL